MNNKHSVIIKQQTIHKDIDYDTELVAELNINNASFKILLPSSSSTNKSSLSDQSQHSCKNKFLEDYLEFKCKLSPSEQNAAIMGEYSSYSSADFLDYNDEKVDIFIKNNKIYVISAHKMIHEQTNQDISFIIQKELDKYKTSKYFFDNCSSTDVQLFSFENCCPTFNKQPDFSFYIYPPGKRNYPSIVGEVAKTNENFKMLLDEIKCYLNEYTHIQYAIGIIFLEKHFFKMRFLVVERNSPQTFFENQEKEIFKKKFQQKEDSKCTNVPNDNYKSNTDYNSKELLEKETSELEEIYNFNIVFDATRTEENIHKEIKFNLRFGQLLEGTEFNSDLETIEIKISEEALRQILYCFDQYNG